MKITIEVWGESGCILRDYKVNINKEEYETLLDDLDNAILPLLKDYPEKDEEE